MFRRIYNGFGSTPAQRELNFSHALAALCIVALGILERLTA